MSAPLVTVVMPVFNAEACVEDAVESVLSQGLRNIELVCIDDASTDGSLQRLKRLAGDDSRMRVLSNETNEGAGAARNRGLAAARGAFVQFTDADDFLVPGALESLHAMCVADGVQACRGAVDGYHASDPAIRVRLSPVEEHHAIRPLDVPEFWTPWWHQAYLFSRSLIDSCGLRFPALRCGEDPVFLAGVLAAVPAISSRPDVVYRYRLAPLEAKGRATFTHLKDFLDHAQRVRATYLATNPRAWHEGYALVLRDDIRPMIERWSMTEDERAQALRTFERVFA